ncbi:MAG: hypothetical protein KDM91_09885 [Verrucomicrobiae bacterium]|nr:hypothetical protein [Verrucomicrobiae bacterium]
MSPADSVIPLVGVDDGGNPELIGSGVFLNIGDRKFILSATHVFTDNKETTIYVDGSGSLNELSGTRYGADRDKEDITFMEIDKDTSDLISTTYGSLPIALVEMSDTTAEGEIYSLTGYSQDRQQAKPNERKFITQRSAYNGTASRDRSYRKCHVSSDSHIVIDISKNCARTDDGNIVVPPTLHCMSGGAVWKKVAEGAPGIPGVRLVGITIEKHDLIGAAVATRINFVIEAIRQKFPELSNLIPRSRTLDVTVKEKTGG